MPTQKVFKQRVRTRMSKTGESYTAARHQLLRKAADRALEPESGNGRVAGAAPEPAPIPPEARLVADEAMVRATGQGHAAWFALLDAWGATGHTHTEIARWLSETHGTPGWWTQTITVSYERARGMRATHQQADGFSISVTRTIDTAPERALEAFTSASLRARWLPDAPMRQRPNKATLVARFDWADPESRLVVAIVSKGDRSTVAIAHERIRDAATADRLKLAWRGWLGDLKTLLEGD